MLWPKREYKSGSTWALWRWTFVPSGYIVRLHLLKTPWFAVCLHWLIKPDPEPYLHDHPVSFISLILRGGYNEWRKRWYRGEPSLHAKPLVFSRLQSETHRWFNFIRATDKHSIVAVRPRTLTLCLMGPKTREWGFTTPDGWVYWKDYYAKQKAKS